MRKTISVIALVWALLLTAGQGLAAQPRSDPQPIRLIEVFTTQDHSVVGTQNMDSDLVHSGAMLEVYAVDGIRRFEVRLSRDLPVNVRKAERMALKRLQQFDSKGRTQLRHAATGLAKAVQYGVDRLPAIVFDGRWVVYGLTDLGTALKHFHGWQAENRS